FHDGNADYFKTRELYLLRNLNKGRGVGFFEAGNFHPDFILWLLAGDKQHVIFVDPQGIRNLGPTDPKIQFYESIKKIKQRLGDPAVNLQSFIISNTPFAEMRRLWRMEKGEMQKQHVLFQEEDSDSYVQSMLEWLALEVRCDEPWRLFSVNATDSMIPGLGLCISHFALVLLCRQELVAIAADRRRKHNRAKHLVRKMHSVTVR
ncbi:MAG: hypothetical protein WCO14_03700, partial [bacterium]